MSPFRVELELDGRDRVGGFPKRRASKSAMSSLQTESGYDEPGRENGYGQDDGGADDEQNCDASSDEDTCGAEKKRKNKKRKKDTPIAAPPTDYHFCRRQFLRVFDRSRCE